MLRKNHATDPDPKSIKTHQCWQCFFAAGPDQCQRSSQRQEIQPPNTNTKYQPWHNDNGLGAPT